MICDRPVQYKWYISFHSITWFHGLYVRTLKAVESKTTQKSKRMIAKLVAIQLIESFSRSTVFIGNNTWLRTIIVDTCFQGTVQTRLMITPAVGSLY